MNKILSFLVAVVLGITQFAQAQTIIKKLQDIKGLHPTYLEFSAADAPVFVRGNVWVQNEKQQLVQQAAKLLRSATDALGYTAYRYQQTINGIPVEDAVYILHVKGGKVLSENGRWAKDLSHESGFGRCNKRSLQLCRNALNISRPKCYRWQRRQQKKMYLKQRDGSTAMLLISLKANWCIIRQAKNWRPPNLRLAFKFDVYATTPLVAQYVFVDALTGTVLGTKDLIQTIDGTANTAYSGSRTIQTTQNWHPVLLTITPEVMA